MPSIPAKIGKYPVIKLIAKGGMGAVYKAKHPTLQREVIIKKLTLVGNRSFAERFKREARFMMDFRNENIVQVYDHFKEGTFYYIVMEYVDGITLEALIERERYLPKLIASMIFFEVCRALKHAHDHNILHRDIKPANILISKEGVVKLVDFGVSTSLEDNEDDGLTQAGMTIGTPSYLAPEQIENAKNKDLRSDIYSMGVLLYEMTTGKKPYPGGFSPDLVNRIKKGKYTPARKVNPEINWKFNRLIQKAMHFKLQKRFQNIDQIILKLTPHLKKNITYTEIKGLIQNYVDHSEQAISDPKEKPGYQKILALTGTLFILLLTASSVLYFSGAYKEYYYQYFLDHKIGVFSVNISMPVSYKKPNEVFIRPTLFVEQAGRLERCQPPDFNFKLKKIDLGIKRQNFESDRIYLPIGNYSLILYAENNQFRENFYLNSINSSDSNKHGSGQRIEFSSKMTIKAQPLKFNFKIYDIQTGTDLSKQTQVSILFKNKWIKWPEYQSKARKTRIFVSGKRYRFRFQLKKYFTEKYFATIRPEQIEFNLTVKMTPKPGSLFIKTKEPDISLLINQSENYTTGGKERHLIEIPKITEKYLELNLFPGSIDLSVKENGMILTAKPTEKKVELHSMEKIYLQISKDQDQNQMSIELIQQKEP
ncbi:MAG: serine/threonine protein kinase [Deltaproteobacteria bacterium]|jgi:eukaryotic-like serine/threonine-protein kinase|nr:serine/threonine protein kinase [Deltaproteobacteria bacterium]MBT4526969.1 serine/threonine protein kinase [Deltaproteobacteria bacterium]